MGGLRGDFGSATNLTIVIFNHLRRFGGGLCTTGGKIPHFFRNNGEPFTVLSRTGGLDRGVQGQKIRLERNVVDDFDDFLGSFGIFRNLFHRGDHLLHHILAAGRCAVRLFRQFIGGDGILRILGCFISHISHRCCDLFNTGRRFG